MATKRDLGRLKSDLTARGWYCENGSEGELVASIENASRPDAETQIVVWEDGAPEVRGIYQADGVRRQGATMLSPQVFAALHLVEAAVTPRLSTVNLLELATTNERLLIAFMLEGLDRSVAALERMQESVQARIDRNAAKRAADISADIGADIDGELLAHFHAEVEADVAAGIGRLVSDVAATIDSPPPAFIVRRRGAGDPDAYVDQLNDEAALGGPDA